MNLSRRQFFTGVATTIAAVSLPLQVVAEVSLPTSNKLLHVSHAEVINDTNYVLRWWQKHGADGTWKQFSTILTSEEAQHVIDGPAATFKVVELNNVGLAMTDHGMYVGEGGGIEFTGYEVDFSTEERAKGLSSNFVLKNNGKVLDF
jgi:hypothetical protein